jgi:integrase
MRRRRSSAETAFSRSGPEEVLDPNEIRKVLEKVDAGYYRTLFLTAYLTGMRSGELFALRWPDIELKGIDAGPARSLHADEFSFAARSLGLA